MSVTVGCGLEDDDLNGLQFMLPVDDGVSCLRRMIGIVYSNSRLTVYAAG